MTDDDSSEFKFTPEYEFLGVNEPVVLRTASLKLCKGEEERLGSAKAMVELVPRPKVTFHCSVEGFFDFRTKPKFEFDGVEIEGFDIFTRIGSDSDRPDLIWTPIQEPVEVLGDDEVEFTHLKFHIFNFSAKVGTRRMMISDGPNRETSISVIEMCGSELELQIWSIKSLSEVHEQLKQTGGFSLTHIAVLSRIDSQSMSAKEAKQIATGINNFLTFANGSRCPPTCMVGVDSSEKRVWEYWSSPGSPWLDGRGWFDGTHPDFLVNLFKGFFDRYNRDQWAHPIHSAIYWYSKSNDTGIGIDSGIILTQAALELLAFEFSVNDKKLISAEGFEKMIAADQLRMLLSSLDIPIAIPPEAKGIAKIAKAENWIDAPQALTIVRNRLVHPKKKKNEDFGDGLFDTWNLGLWYLELVILRLCGYEGQYGNRITQQWAGEKDTVPWSSHIA